MTHDVSTAEAHTVVCPNCNAQPHQPCTQPTDTGRVKVNWVHLTREEAFRKAQMSRVHAARPVSETDDHCQVCGQHTKRVPGGQGPTYVHRDTGAVAAPNPPRS